VNEAFSRRHGLGSGADQGASMCRGPYARPPRISGGIGARAGDSDEATRPHDAGPGRRRTNAEGPGRRLGADSDVTADSDGPGTPTISRQPTPTRYGQTWRQPRDRPTAGSSNEHTAAWELTAREPFGGQTARAPVGPD
jgi:hypothetical protein